MKPKKLTTLAMEVRMMTSINPRQNLTVLNPSWGMSFRIPGSGWKQLHECDIIYITKSNHATEIEIKISKSDLVKDKFKPHKHDHPKIARLYFAVPENLEEIAIKEIPEHAGLYVVRQVKTYYSRYGYGENNQDGEFYYRDVVDLVRKAKRRPNAMKWTDKEMMELARLGTLRILPLKRKILELQSKTITQCLNHQKD